jgi:hypothetical protein
MGLNFWSNFAISVDSLVAVMDWAKDNTSGYPEEDCVVEISRDHVRLYHRRTEMCLSDRNWEDFGGLI